MILALTAAQEALGLEQDHVMTQQLLNELSTTHSTAMTGVGPTTIRAAEPPSDHAANKDAAYRRTLTDLSQASTKLPTRPS